MLVTKNLFFLLIAETTAGDLVSVRICPLSNAATAHKYLGLQQKLVFASLALHVVYRIPMFHVGIETKNHVLFIHNPQEIADFR